ncbi:hypothetical protein QQS21_003665 [Conoideocrella luteorostrata]|uniref:NAD(P)-binding domain-containing protein n=1 Tax=Conoideocrella luteorostrata TaxID=1105319 RepID=A0AAJ0CSV9_9HYPO|nr:hypothetical protein QQS21_003665 [Conoideocrella luteorostrata]
MTYHMTVLPASSRAGASTIRFLLEANSQLHIQGIYRDPSKAPAAFREHANFQAVKGDVSQASSLDFTGSDAVFYNQPPTYDGSDLGEFASETATNVKNALVAAGVKKLVILSALGSQYESGIGVLRINHISDEILKDAVPEVVVIRAGYFAEDFSHVFESIKADPPKIISQFTPSDWKVPIVSVQDVGEQSARALLERRSGVPSPHFMRLFGPRLYSSDDVQAAVKEITGTNAELVLPEKDGIVDFFAQQFPRGVAEELAEMVVASLEGGNIAKEYEYNDDTIVGKMELVDALRLKYHVAA